MDVNSCEIFSRETSCAMEQREISRKNSRGEFTTSIESFHVNSQFHIFVTFITSCPNFASLEQTTVASSLNVTLVTRRQTRWSVFSFPRHWNTQWVHALSTSTGQPSLSINWSRWMFFMDSPGSSGEVITERTATSRSMNFPRLRLNW